MIKIAPSLLAADFTKLGSEVESLNTTQANMLHLDIMDGIFVPNISFGYDIVKQIRPISSLIFDVHLMISNASKYIDKFADAGANSITVHYEAVDDVPSIINLSPFFIASTNFLSTLAFIVQALSFSTKKSLIVSLPILTITFASFL